MAQENNSFIKHLFNNWSNVVAPVRNDLVFENKNKTYGAYYLRTSHNRTIAYSLIITSIVFVLLIGFPKILDWINNKTEEVEVPVEITNVDLLPPPPIDETEPPPPPPPPPTIETVKFTPPVVTDEEVVDEPPPIQKEDMPQISTVTQEGDDEKDIVIPQETSNKVVEAKPEEVFNFVEQQPSFPGGDAEMMKFIQKNIQYPEKERESGIKGTCVVSFVVEKDGSITNVKVVRGIANGQGCDKEALRVINMMPTWKAGKNNGREVRARFNLPIKFSLQ